MTQETHYEWLLRMVRTDDRRHRPFAYRPVAYTASTAYERRSWDIKTSAGDA